MAQRTKLQWTPRTVNATVLAFAAAVSTGVAGDQLQRSHQPGKTALCAEGDTLLWTPFVGDLMSLHVYSTVLRGTRFSLDEPPLDFRQVK